MKRKPLQTAPAPAAPLRLDLGCGTNKQPEYTGIDIRSFPGVDVVCDLRKRWPWDDNSVDDVYSAHFVEHLTGDERVGFFNELHRVLKIGSKALIVTPDWSNDKAYGDPTHRWPPMSRWYVFYLNKAWRSDNAPHVGYVCDFDFVIAGSWEKWLETRNQRFKEFATQQYTNAMSDLVVTLIKRP